MSDSKGSFSYAIDDSLNVVVNQQLKDQVLAKRNQSISKELKELEKEKQIKWRSDFEIDLEEEQSRIKISIKKLNKHLQKLNSDISNIAVGISGNKSGAYAFSAADSNDKVIVKFDLDSVLLDSMIAPPVHPTPLNNN
jgi:hypothetical protein